MKTFNVEVQRIKAMSNSHGLVRARVDALVQPASPRSEGDESSVLSLSVENARVLYLLLKVDFEQLEFHLADSPTYRAFCLLGLGDPAVCTTGFLPPSAWRSPADTTTIDAPDNLYCKLPQNSPIGLRGVRNFPCQNKPGKRAPTPEVCHGGPYVPKGPLPSSTDGSGK